MCFGFSQIPVVKKRATEMPVASGQLKLLSGKMNLAGILLNQFQRKALAEVENVSPVTNSFACGFARYFRGSRSFCQIQ